MKNKGDSVKFSLYGDVLIGKIIKVTDESYTVRYLDHLAFYIDQSPVQSITLTEQDFITS